MTSLAEPVPSPRQASDLRAVLDAVVGGDTHRDTHHLELCDPQGIVLARLEVPNTAEGNVQALAWIADRAPGRRVLIGLEGTRSYGIGLSRALQAAGLPVVEVERPSRTDRRGRGKSDPIDAHHAALAVLRMDPAKLPTPRLDGDREGLRILLAARRDLTLTSTRQANALHALLLTGDDHDRQLSRGKFTVATLTTLRRRRGRADDSREQTIRRLEATRLATALLQARDQLKTNLRQLTDLVEHLADGLTDRPGIGPVSAAQAVVSFSHPGRLTNEAAFASLAGVSPLPASSGRTHRHRLNRGGDRALNRALHDIAKTRMRCDPRTQTYVQRRRSQGLSDREIRRCLKRYIARELYRALTNSPTSQPTKTLDNT
jgi:transposase